MPRKLSVADRLPVADLERRYRAARDPVARTHLQLVWLVASGHTCAEAARATGYCVDWVRAVVARYNADGPDALGDRRRGNPGAKPLLTAAQEGELREALGGAAPDGGLWTGKKVAAWMGERVGRPLHEARGWEAMTRLGFRPLRPRPKETRADAGAQAAFKKGGSKRPWMASPPRTPGQP
jgi:transposase